MFSRVLILCIVSFISASTVADELASPAKPVFKDGEAQVVEAFNQGWIRHDLWVETEFDSDGNGL